MQYVLIKNKGEIEEAALTLLGASSKSGDETKIGYFGTGLKYAIAFFLRNGIKIHVFSGDREIVVDTRLQTFRGQHINVVYVNGHQTSLTTAMGKDWKVWQAIREIYCNGLDEPGFEMSIVDDPVFPDDGYQEGETRIYIQATHEVAQIITADQFPLYFCANTPVLLGNVLCDVIEKTGEKVNIFRKGIRAWDSESKSVYDYNFHRADINEARIVSNWYQILFGIAATMKNCKVPEMIEKWLSIANNEDYIENDIFDSDIIDGAFNLAWGRILKTRLFAHPIMMRFMDPKEQAEATWLPEPLFRMLHRQFPEMRVPASFTYGDSGFVPATTTTDERQFLQDTLEYMRRVGYPIRYPVVIVQFMREGVLGSADLVSKQILVCPDAIRRTTTDLMITLIEEQVHIEHGVKDYTRSFMDRTLSEFVNYIRSQHPL